MIMKLAEIIIVAVVILIGVFLVMNQGAGSA